MESKPDTGVTDADGEIFRLTPKQAERLQLYWQGVDDARALVSERMAIYQDALTTLAIGKGIDVDGKMVAALPDGTALIVRDRTPAEGGKPKRRSRKAAS